MPPYCTRIHTLSFLRENGDLGRSQSAPQERCGHVLPSPRAPHPALKGSSRTWGHPIRRAWDPCTPRTVESTPRFTPPSVRTGLRRSTRRHRSERSETLKTRNSRDYRPQGFLLMRAEGGRRLGSQGRACAAVLHSNPHLVLP